ncbi:MAG: adenylate/guanylate cyclase domain-containing protein, partial [Pseudomonadota bacterium]
NNPVEVQDPVRAALDAAHAIRRELSGSRFACRIGLAYGPVVSGRIGSSSRQAFTVYGEAVNIAARLQDHGKSAGASFLVDRNFTQIDLTDWRALGEVELRGIGTPVEAYCL